MRIRWIVGLTVALLALARSGSAQALTITAPTSGQVVTNHLFTVWGTSTNDTSGLGIKSDVRVQLNNGGWFVPTGSGTGVGSTSVTTNWFEPSILTPGSNTVQAYAVDIHGNVSATNMVIFDYVPGGIADLSLRASAAPEPVSGGSNLVYTLVVSNAGPATATGVEISSLFPASAFVVSAATSVLQSPQNGGVLLMNLSSLAVGATNAVQFVVHPTVNGKLTNVFQLFADQTDPVPANNSVTLVSTITNAPLTGIPGNPYSHQCMDSTIYVAEFAGVGAQSFPAIYSGCDAGATPTTAIPGDVVMLLAPSGGNNPTNWAAVMRFFNPNDPTGTNGLAATEDQAFFPAQFGSNGLASFHLFPNVAFYSGMPGAYLGEVAAVATEVGPNVTLAAGQIAIFTLLVSNSVAVSITSPVAGQQVSNQVFTVTGTASAVGPVSNVWVQLNGGSWVHPTTANGWTNWSTLVTFTAPNSSDSVQAYAVDLAGNVSATNTVAFGNVLLNIPGTPYVGSWNPVTTTSGTIFISERVGIEVEPFQAGFASFVTGGSGSPTNAIPGDVVLLIDPAGGTNTSNWAALARFSNPSDPMGTNGLAATEDQAFFPAQFGINGFANFHLFPNAAFYPATATSPGETAAVFTEVGPNVGLNGGQIGIFVLTVSNSVSVTITSPTNGQVVNGPISVSGTTTDSAMVTNLYYSVNGGSWLSAINTNGLATTTNGWANWMIYWEFIQLTPGTNTVQVYAVDTNGLASATNSVTVDYAVGRQGRPGTPYTMAGVYGNASLTVYCEDTFGVSVQPFLAGLNVNSWRASNALPGDIVLLLNPTGGNNYTNWAAVARFFNPGDPTGTNGLLATETQAFFPDSFGTNGFAGFQLFPVVDYYPATYLAPGVVSEVATEVGPVGVIPAGEVAIFILTVSNSVSVTITSPTTGQVESNEIISVSGTTTDSAAVTNVYYSLNSGSWNAASTYGGWTNWIGNFVKLTPGTNIIQAYAVDTNGVASATNSVTFDYVVSTQGLPGIPYGGLNSGGATIYSSDSVGIGVQPFQAGISIGNPDPNGSLPTNAIPGDIVVLINPTGGHSPTNWAAVARYFNPSDPTGTNGLTATETRAYFPFNAGTNGFANFQLFPNAAFYSAGGVVTSNANIDVVMTAVGPMGGLAAGQMDIILLTILANSVSVAITSPTNELVVSNAAFTVTGTAMTIASLASVTNVYVQLKNGGWSGATSANGWTNWTANVTLTTGSNTVSAYAVDTYGNVSATNSVTFDYAPNESVQADLKLTASYGDPVLLYPLLHKPDLNWLYSLTVSNGGPATATGVVLSNQVPTNVICGGHAYAVNVVSATGGATPTNGVLLLNLGSLPPGATNTVQILESITPVGTFTPSTNGLVANVFQVFANETDPVPTNNAAAFLAPINPTTTTFSTANFTNSVSATATVQSNAYSTELIAKLPNGTVVYDQIFNVAYSNATVQSAITTAAGDLTGAGATSFTGPTQTSFLQNLLGSSSVTATNPIGTAVTPFVTMYVGPQTIFVGTNQSVAYPILAGTLDYDVLQTTVVTNLATTTITSNYLASSVYMMTGIVAQVDVALSLMAAPNPVSVGAPLTYSLTVTNNSSTTATGVVVSNTLPPSVTFISALPSQGSATNQAGVVTYFVGSLANGVAANLAIIVVPNAAGLLTNLASASSTQTDSQPANNRVTNVTTAVSVPITNLVLTVLSPITLNPQTGLFEQRIQVANGGPATPSSVLVRISGLATNAHLYNASGSTNGTPFVQSAAPLGVGSNVFFLLEYYVPTRVAPTNLTFTVQAGPIVIPLVVNGTLLSIGRTIVLANGNVLVEFSAVPGQIYAVQYSRDMVTWQTAVPAITAPANRVQWIDSGPPKTFSSPAQQGARYYRVVLLTAH